MLALHRIARFRSGAIERPPRRVARAARVSTDAMLPRRRRSAERTDVGISSRRSSICEGGEEDSLTLYRLLAVEQSLRAVAPLTRDTFAGLGTPQARDLFRIADAAIVDRWVGGAHAWPHAGARQRARRCRHAAARDAPDARVILSNATCSAFSTHIHWCCLGSARRCLGGECARWADRVAPSATPRATIVPSRRSSYWGEFREPGRAGGAPWYGGMDDSSPPAYPATARRGDAATATRSRSGGRRGRPGDGTWVDSSRRASGERRGSIRAYAAGRSGR